MTVYLVPGVFGAGGQILDDNSNVASGALVNVYAAGTTSTVAVFTTATGNVTAANPVPTNANGRLPYELWQTGGQAIKIVLTDALANTLGTYDNLVGINDPANLLATSNVWTANQTFSAASVFLSTVTISSNAVFVSNVSVSGNLSVAGSITVTGIATFVSNVAITGNLTASTVTVSVLNVTSLNVTSLSIAGNSVGMVFLTSGAVTTNFVSTVNVSLNQYSAFSNKVLVLENWSPTVDNVPFLMRTSTNGGITFISSASYDTSGLGLKATTLAGFTTGVSVAAVQIWVNGCGATTNVGNASTEGICAKITMLNMTTATKQPVFDMEGHYLDGNTNMVRFFTGGQLNLTVSVTDLQFYFSSGSVSTGRYALYGVNQ